MTLDFVDETPSLEDSYANSSAPEPTLSRSRLSTQQPSAKRIIIPKTRGSPYATSKDDSEAWIPTPSHPSNQIPSPLVANKRIDKSIEVENNESAPPEHSIAALSDEDHYEESAPQTETPQEGATHWLPRSYELSFANVSESTVPFNETPLQSAEAQNEKVNESEYWPHITVQESYLMRYFIDKLACWVSSSQDSGGVG